MIFIWIVLPIIAIGVVIFYLFRKIYRAVDFCKGEMKKSKKNIAAINFNTGSCIERNLVFCSFTFGSIPAYHRSNNVDWKKSEKE